MVCSCVVVVCGGMWLCSGGVWSMWLCSCSVELFSCGAWWRVMV